MIEPKIPQSGENGVADGSEDVKRCHDNGMFLAKTQRRKDAKNINRADLKNLLSAHNMDVDRMILSGIHCAHQILRPAKRVKLCAGLRMATTAILNGVPVTLNIVEMYRDEVKNLGRAFISLGFFVFAIVQPQILRPRCRSDSEWH